MIDEKKTHNDVIVTGMKPSCGCGTSASGPLWIRPYIISQGSGPVLVGTKLRFSVLQP